MTWSTWFCVEFLWRECNGAFGFSSIVVTTVMERIDKGFQFLSSMEAFVDMGVERDNTG